MKIFELVYGLVFFIPLIQSTAGNVGIQSSAIMVQGLANGTIKAKFSTFRQRIFVGTFERNRYSSYSFGHQSFRFGTTFITSIAIIIALITVIINAALIGTFIPIFLNNRGIDPAVSTGPFITTSNDVLGVFIYFVVAKLILGV